MGPSRAPSFIAVDPLSKCVATLARSVHWRATIDTVSAVYEFLRRLMFLLPPETSHEVALTALRIAERTGLSQRYVHGIYQPTTVMGLKFRNRVGLAAGLDKDARCIEGLLAMGFGFIEVGTVTPRPQPGNPRPRLFRLPSEARADQSHGVQQRRCGGRCRARAIGARAARSCGRTHRREHRQEQRHRPRERGGRLSERVSTSCTTSPTT